MKSFLAACVAATLLLPAALSAQESADDKEKKKQEQQKADDEAKAVLKEYQAKRNAALKAQKESELIDAIDLLKDAKPHRLIRTELLSLLGGPLPPKVRLESADALGNYKKDAGACDALLRHARSERGSDPEVLDLRKKCLRSFGTIAPFAKSVDLEILFSEPEHDVARAAVEAAETIKSVRMLRSLVALLSELERISDSEGKDPGPEVPGGPPKQGENNSKRKRKEVLLEPTKKAINSIWSKVDSKKPLKDYTEANRAMQDRRADIKKVQDEEDAQDRKP